jgi:hypothetical protein
VYGRWLPWLLLLDERWVADRKPEMFPGESDLAGFRAAVWDTYISWNRPYDSSFRVLAAEYRDAVAAVPTGRKAQTHDRDTIDVKVGEHIITYWCRGVADEQLVDEFFERADDDTAAQVMEDLGWSLSKTTGEVPPEIAARMQALWDKRLAVGATDPEAHTREMRTFGNTFAAAKLDEAWAIDRLEQAIELGGAPKPAQWLVERLAVVGESRPADAARILDAMLQRVDTPWAHVGWSDHARAIAALALRSNDPAAVQDGQSIVDFFVRRGELEFRDLLT